MEDPSSSTSQSSGSYHEHKIKKYATDKVKKLKDRASSWFDLNTNESDSGTEPRVTSKVATTPLWTQELFNTPNVPRRLSGNERDTKNSNDDNKKLSMEYSRNTTHDGQDISDILDIQPEDVAKQLTLMTAELFRKIPRNEILSMGWTGSQKSQLAPKIVKITDQFNQTAIWVAQQILEATEIRRRFQLICFYIRVAKACYNWNNFDGMRAVVSGLQSTPVHRLERTWAMVSRREMAVFEKLCILTSADNNSEAYRRRLEQIKPPLIPNIGIHLGDITFVYECMKKDKDNQERQDQYRDREIQYHDMIQSLAKWQASCIYQFPVDDLVTTLIKSGIDTIKPEQIKETVDEHYKASYRIEAKPISLSSTVSSTQHTTRDSHDQKEDQSRKGDGFNPLRDLKISTGSIDQLSFDLKSPRRGKSAGSKVTPDEAPAAQSPRAMFHNIHLELQGKFSQENKYTSLPSKALGKNKPRPTIDTILTSPTQKKADPTTRRMPTSASSSALSSPNDVPMTAPADKLKHGIPLPHNDVLNELVSSGALGKFSKGNRGYHVRSTSEGYSSPNGPTPISMDLSGEDDIDTTDITGEESNQSANTSKPQKSGGVVEKLIQKIKNKQRSNTLDPQMRHDIVNNNRVVDTRDASIDDQESNIHRTLTTNSMQGRTSLRLPNNPPGQLSTGPSSNMPARIVDHETNQSTPRPSKLRSKSISGPGNSYQNTNAYPIPDPIDTLDHNQDDSDSSNGSHSSADDLRGRTSSASVAGNSNRPSTAYTPFSSHHGRSTSPTEIHPPSSQKKPVGSLVLRGVLKRKHDKRTTTDALMRKKKWYRVWTVLDHWTLSFYTYHSSSSTVPETPTPVLRPKPLQAPSHLSSSSAPSPAPSSLTQQPQPPQHQHQSGLSNAFNPLLHNRVSSEEPSSRSFFGYKRNGRSSSNIRQIEHVNQTTSNTGTIGNFAHMNLSSPTGGNGMTRTRSGTSTDKSSGANSKKDAGPELLECIPLKVHSSVTILPDSKGRHVLQLSPDFNSYVILRCKTENELNLWVQGIRTAIDMLKKETEQSAAASTT